MSAESLGILAHGFDCGLYDGGDHLSTEFVAQAVALAGAC